MLAVNDTLPAEETPRDRLALLLKRFSAIPALPRGLSDAMGCQVAIGDKIIALGADYLLALRGDQPTLEADVAEYFRSAPSDEGVVNTTVEKGYGRIETRTYLASAKVDWMLRQELSRPAALRRSACS